MADTIKIGSLDISAFKVGSSDCKIYLGDTKLYPKDISYKLIANYSDSSVYQVECDGTSALTASEVSGHTTPKSAMTSAEVSACDNNGFRIDTNAFYGASAMTSITIDNNVTEFGNQAFMGCSGLTSFTFPTGLTKIDGSCFRLCNKIKTLEVPNGVEYLKSGCFADMSALSSATIPASVTQIGTNLFLRDSALKEVHFLGRTAPATFSEDAFKNTGIQKIYIPDCDCYDSYAAKPGVSAFTTYIYGESGDRCRAQFKFVRNHLTSTYTYPCESIVSTLSTGQTRSGSSMSTITGTSNPCTAVTIGECCQNMSQGAFSGWTKLQYVSFANGNNKTLGNYAFRDCTALKEVNLGKKVTAFNTNPFSGCTALKNIIIEATTPPTLNNSSYIPSSVTAITIPCGSKSTYINSSNIWSGLSSKLVEDCEPRWVNNGNTACMNGYITYTEEEQIYNATSSSWEYTGRYRALSATTSACTNTPSVKYTNAASLWSIQTDSNGNVNYMSKSASNTGELTTAKLEVSGLTSIKFSVTGADNSGIEFTATIDGEYYHQSVKGSGTFQITTLLPRNQYSIQCHLLAKDGTYVTGTVAHANITWV